MGLANAEGAFWFADHLQCFVIKGALAGVEKEIGSYTL